MRPQRFWSLEEEEEEGGRSCFEPLGQQPLHLGPLGGCQRGDGEEGSGVAGIAAGAAADALVARVVKVVKRDPVLGDAKRLVEVLVEAVGVAQRVLHVKGLVKGELVKVKGALLGGVGAVERDGAVNVVDARASLAVAGRRVGRELADHGVDGPAEAFGVVLPDGVVALVGAVVRAQAALEQVAQRVDHVVRRALWGDRSLGGHQGVHVGKVLAEIAGVVVKAGGVSVLLVAEQHNGIALVSPDSQGAPEGMRVGLRVLLSRLDGAAVVANHLDRANRHEVEDPKLAVAALVKDEPLLAVLRVHADRLIVGVKPRVQASAGNGDVADLAAHGRPGEVALKLGAVAGF